MPSTTRVSASGAGVQGDSWSQKPSLSPDGQTVVFSSTASNLVAGDTNGDYDVFLRDRQAGTIERVSLTNGGAQTAGAMNGVLSGNGRFVAFESWGTNLVPGDTNGWRDVFVRDLQAGTTERVSVATAGTQGNDQSFQPSISDDGRYVAFLSDASNLVAGDTNGQKDVFVRDRQLGQTARISVATAGTQANSGSQALAMAGDGSSVVFTSSASNLVPGDTNGTYDTFVRDLATDETERVSVKTGGAQVSQGSSGDSFGVSISADARYVAFVSTSFDLGPDWSFLSGIFVHDRSTEETTLVSVGPGGVLPNDWTQRPRLSRDGSFVAYTSRASNLVLGDSNSYADVFVYDRSLGTTERVSVASDGMQGNDQSDSASISDDGDHVAFDSWASTLVSGDTNDTLDVFVRDRGLPAAPGQLRVTTTPAVPGQIIVDGVPRDSWGLNWVEFPVGEHEVCFGPVPGFTPPPCTTVDVEAGLTTVVDGTYTQRGTLRVLTSPALPSTVTIEGQPANDWGVWTDLDPGTYEVCFGAVADFAPPACQDAVITAGATATITGTFMASPGAPGPAAHGYLRATTTPAVASRVLVDGAVADSWGLTWLKLPVGTHEVCFEAVLYATAPDCEDIQIVAGQTAQVDGVFVTHGFLRVLTNPAVGATISVDGQPANAWGVWTSLEPGTYEVCYGDVPGLTAPPCEDAVVTAGDTVTLTGTYVG